MATKQQFNSFEELVSGSETTCPGGFMQPGAARAVDGKI
jgi:hypothetical protein